MAGYCNSCGCRRPSEVLTREDYRTSTCNDCASRPLGERQARRQEQEIWDYLRQSHISAENMARLGKLASSPDPGIAELARVVFDVAQATPYKRRRLKILARQRRDLLDDLRRTGLILAHHW